MINKIKKRIISILVNYNKCIWQSSKKLKVCIQTNNYFTPKSWLDSYKKSSLFDKIEIQFANNKIDFIKLSEKADIIFCFGQNRFVRWNRDDLKMVYFGLNGIEFIDRDAFSPNTKIEFVKGLAANAIAEYTVLMSLIFNRKLQNAFFDQYRRKWNQKNVISCKFVPINKKIIGIMGIGRIGKVIAEKFKKLNCTVYGYNQNISQNNEFVDKLFTPNKITEFLKIIDVLIISLSLNKDTYNLINKNRLQLLKKQAVIINVSRGDIIDEKALVYSLKNNEIAGAALDVFSSEPLHRMDKLWKTPNLIITPHIAGNINCFVQEIQDDFFRKLEKYNYV